jgi:HEAT repeat protein
MTRPPSRLRFLRPRSLGLALAIALPSAALGANSAAITAFVTELLPSGPGKQDNTRTPPVRSAESSTLQREAWPRQAHLLRSSLESEVSPSQRAELVARLGIIGGPQDVELVLELSEHPSPVLKAAAIEALGRLGTARSIDRLTTLAEISEFSGIAIPALGLSTTGAALHALETIADSQDPHSRQLAYRAMAVHGGDRVRRLLHAAWEETTLDEARSIATALAALGGPQERRLLAFVATQSSDPRSSAALLGLSALPDQQSSDLLLDLARNAKGRQRLTALELIARLNDEEAVEVLLEAWHRAPATRTTVLRSLGKSPVPGALDALLELITDLPHSHAPAYTEALSVRPEPTAREVLRALAKEDGFLAETALAALAQRNDQDVVKVLLERFDTDGELPPQETLIHLATHGGDAGWELMEEVLAVGSESDQGAVIWALQRRGDDDAVDRLLDLARHETSWTGIRAISALEHMPGKARDSLREVLLDQLEDPNGADISTTIASLGRMGGEGVHAALSERLQSGTVSEKWASISALSTLPGPEARGTLEGLLEDSDPNVRSSALNALVHHEDGPLSLDLINKALSDDSASVRSRAFSALSIQGTPEATERLVELSQAEATETRIQALRALGSAGGQQAEETLLAAVNDPKVASSALWTLERMGSSSGEQAIRDLARDPNSSVQVQALGMLGNDSSRHATEILRSSLDTESPEQAGAAVRALQTRGDTHSAEAIADFFDSMDPEDLEVARLRQQTAGTLRALGGPLAAERAEEIEESLQTSFSLLEGLGEERFHEVHFDFNQVSHEGFGMGATGFGTSH